MSLLLRFTTLCLLALTSTCVWALDDSDLLPVDQAFQLHASAPQRDAIELEWKIAPGYYLYRHRVQVSAGPGFDAAEPTLPEGQRKHDPYFGDVQIYHDHLLATVAGEADPGTDSVTLEVGYQGCADAGVCYPPQKRTLKVHLPPAPAPSLPVAATNPLPAMGLPGSGPSLNINSALPGSGPALAGVQALPLPAEQAFQFEAIADGGNKLLLRFTPAPGYYLYRDRTSLALDGTHAIRTGIPSWPAGQKHHDEHFGDVVVYFNQTEVALPLLRDKPDPAQVTLVATFQGCQTDGICYPPMTRRVELDLPAGKVTPPEQASAAALPILPPEQPVVPANPEARDTSSDAANAEDSNTVGTDHPDASADNAGRSLPAGTGVSGLLTALLLALLGGLILNLMPCVLPVLSLKVLGLAHSAESRARARSHALWYTFGVLVAFTAIGTLVIGLRAAGQAAGWGFQLQQPWFVAALVYLMFVVGLSMTGVFTLGSNLGGVGQQLASRQGPLGDFCGGVLACVVASPCIAPFMGTALAYAFTAPTALALLVFLALGLGLSLPFLLIGLVPSLAKRLPQPGAWMVTLKQVLAVPMYLAAIWLAWVLGKQRGVDAIALVLVGSLLLTLGLRWFEHARWRSLRWGRALSILLMLLALVPIWAVTRIAPPNQTQAKHSSEVAYSPEMLDRLRADNRVIFVNITADWCVTCKANERHVLASNNFHDLLQRTDTVYMKGDWTNVDPQISEFLDKHHAVGVPLYVVYGPGAPPRILPTVLTEAVVEDALLRAAR